MPTLPARPGETWVVTPRDAVLVFSRLTFDASVMGPFTPLLAGALVLRAPRRAGLAAPAGGAAAAAGGHVRAAAAVRAQPAGRRAVPGPAGAADRRRGAARRAGPALGRTGPDVRQRLRPHRATAIATYQVLDAGCPPAPPPIGRANRPNYQVYVLDPS